MKKLILILTAFSMSLSAFEPVYNAQIWYDGDGVMLIYTNGHFYISDYPEHFYKCPCGIN